MRYDSTLSPALFVALSSLLSRHPSVVHSITTTTTKPNIYISHCVFLNFQNGLNCVEPFATTAGTHHPPAPPDHTSDSRPCPPAAALDLIKEPLSPSACRRPPAFQSHAECGVVVLCVAKRLQQQQQRNARHQQSARRQCVFWFVHVPRGVFLCVCACKNTNSKVPPASDGTHNKSTVRGESSPLRGVVHARSFPTLCIRHTLA